MRGEENERRSTDIKRDKDAPNLNHILDHAN
jgi:hypothetical protein